MRSVAQGDARQMCHVLIIEDEPFVAMGIELMLGDIGATSFDVAVAEDEAVAAAMAHPPALITSDVKLIEGTGPQAVEAIQKRLRAIPVIFITATPEACDRCGPPAVVLSKPVCEKDLTAAFKGLL